MIEQGLGTKFITRYIERRACLLDVLCCMYFSTSFIFFYTLLSGIYLEPVKDVMVYVLTSSYRVNSYVQSAHMNKILRE